MAYKFQLGAATMSGSLTQEGALDATSFDANSGGISNAGAITGASTIAATGLASVGSIAVDDGSTIGTDSDSDMLTLTNGSDIAVASDLDFNIAKAGGLQIAGTAVTSTAAELNYVAGVTPGTSAVSKALVLDANGDIDDTQLRHITANGDIAAATISGSSTISGGGLVIAGSTVSAAGLALIDDADASAQRTTLGLGTSNNVQFAEITGSAIALLDTSGIVGDGLIDNGGVIDLDIPSLAAAMTGDVADTDEFAISDGGVMKHVDFSVVRDAVFNDVSGDATIAAGGALTIAAGAVENSMLSSSFVTIGSTAVALGNTQTSFSGLTGLNFTAADASIAAGLGANTLTLGGATSTIRVAGDLDVVGTLNRVTETELLIEDKAVIVASGSANAAAAAGAGLKVDIATGDMTWLYQANGENVGGVDASASGDIFVASGSAGLIDIQAASFYGDGSKLTNITAEASKFAINFYNTGSTTNANAAHGLWIVNSPTGQGAANTQLDLSGSWADGAIVVVKAAGDTGANVQPITIAANVGAGHSIDGANSIELESDLAAVTLVYSNTTNGWHII